ncbi:MAG: class I SAM-dependent methyltransferase [Phototrophicaceae bacterium]
MFPEIAHPEFVRLLQESDAELFQQSVADLQAQLLHASTIQEEGFWSEELWNYIEASGQPQYIHLHWNAERYYADKLNHPDEYFNHYYLIGYARIVWLVLRYMENMGYDRDDFYFIRGFLQNAFDHKDVSILEIGAGEGKLIRDLLSVGYHNIEGIEMAVAALQGARRMLANILPKSSLHEMSFEEFRKQFPDRRYDVAIHAHLIEHLPISYAPTFLKEIYDTLNPHGYMVVITPSRLNGPHDVTRYFRPGGSEPEGFHLKEYTLRELEALLSSAGFGNFQTVQSLPTLNNWWESHPTPQKFTYKRDLESFLMNLTWEQRKPIVDGMYYVGMVCQRLD